MSGSTVSGPKRRAAQASARVRQPGRRPTIDAPSPLSRLRQNSA